MVTDEELRAHFKLHQGTIIKAATGKPITSHRNQGRWAKVHCWSRGVGAGRETVGLIRLMKVLGG